MTCVLIIDDSPTESYAYEMMLKKKGYEVITAANGVDGVSMAKNRQPDVILMDVVMPGLNGFQATRQLTKAQDTSHIPVIMISTKDQETDRVWGQRQGASEYLVKPVAQSALLTAIDKVLN
ncbi:MAG: response regulator [Pseudomonadales bacterium]|jgi:twitching motility two-component system response regulator PilH